MVLIIIIHIIHMHYNFLLKFWNLYLGILNMLQFHEKGSFIPTEQILPNRLQFRKTNLFQAAVSWELSNQDP